MMKRLTADKRENCSDIGLDNLEFLIDPIYNSRGPSKN